MALLLKNKINQTHKSYSSKAKDFDMYDAVIACGDDLLSAKYIPRHEFESTTSYGIRLRRAFTINLFQNILVKVSGLLFSDPVIRYGEGIEGLNGFIQDSTGNGVSFGNYMVEAISSSMVFGKSFSVVLMNARAGKTQADVENGSMFPYVMNFSRKEMTNWVFEPRIGYTECIFKKKIPFLDEENEVFIYVTTDSVGVYDRGGRELKGTHLSYKHQLGYCPVFPLVYTGVGASIGEVLSRGQIGITNLLSVFDEIAERQAFSQLVIPDDGTIQELQHKASDIIQAQVATGEISEEAADPLLAASEVLYRLSQSKAITWPSGTGHPPSFISPNGSQLENIYNSILGLKKELLSSTGLADADGEITMDSAGHILVPFSTSLEAHEKRILDTAARYANFSSDVYSMYTSVNMNEDIQEVLAVCDSVVASTALNDKAKNAIVDSIMKKHLAKYPHSALFPAVNHKE